MYQKVINEKIVLQIRDTTFIINDRYQFNFHNETLDSNIQYFIGFRNEKKWIYMQLKYYSEIKQFVDEYYIKN